jgi:hypothetical protein
MMRDYLDRMAAPAQPPAPDVAYQKIIGANCPKMLALSGEVADGALPAMVPPQFTAQARQLLGPGELFAAGLAVVADADQERGRGRRGRRLPAGSASRHVRVVIDAADGYLVMPPVTSAAIPRSLIVVSSPSVDCSACRHGDADVVHQRCRAEDG